MLKSVSTMELLIFAYQGALWFVCDEFSMIMSDFASWL
jgi:hypothetical protein